ncbi:hypothetical protein V6N13_144181 [Hibiscus sabdariffa]
MVDSNKFSGPPGDTPNHNLYGNAPPEGDLALNALAQEVQKSLCRRDTGFGNLRQFKDMGDSSLPESPIEAPTPLSEVKQEPYPQSCMNGSLDKWRNLSVSTSTKGAKDKSRAPKVKATVASLPSTPNSSAPAASRALTATIDAAVGDSSNNSLDGKKNAPRYSTMISEALSTIKGTNGSDITEIQRYEVPPTIPFEAKKTCFSRQTGNGNCDSLWSNLPL